MRWIIEDLKLAIRQLKRSEVWMFIGILAAFSLIAFIVASFALQTDSLLRYLRLTVYNCREMTNGPIIFLFSGMIFFMLSAVVTFGDIQRYYFCKKRGIVREANRALKHGILAGSVAVLIAVGALVFFKTNCY